MSDIEKTRRIQDVEPAARTRLIRHPDSKEEARPVSSDAPRTKLVGRPGPAQSVEAVANASEGRLVTGWLVVVKGPGRGKFAPVFDGMNSVGRGADQATALNFGDESISRGEHAFVTYDYVDRKFYITHGGKANLVRVNGRPVLQPTSIVNGDMIEVGNTVCRFTSFCSDDFDWQCDL